MGALIGFIVTFLGASIFNIAAGVPFLPLQTLWVNFTTQVFQAIGLGYGKPDADLMRRKPRPSDERILPRERLLWLTVLGLVLGVGTLGVIAWGENAHGTEVARTMGLTTFSLFNLFLSFTVKDELRSVFSLDTFDHRRFVLMSGMSVAAIVLATEFGPFQRLLKTVELDLGQWLVCIVVASSVILVTEIRKAVSRRRVHSTPVAPGGGRVVATAAA